MVCCRDFLDGKTTECISHSAWHLITTPSILAIIVAFLYYILLGLIIKLRLGCLVVSHLNF